MALTAAEVLIDTIHDWGVDVIFGLPGDGINGIIEALRKNQDKIRFVHVRHEEAAAFMACGYAKDTHAQQDVELDKLFMDVCVYNTRIIGPRHVSDVPASGA